MPSRIPVSNDEWESLGGGNDSSSLALKRNASANDAESTHSSSNKTAKSTTTLISSREKTKKKPGPKKQKIKDPNRPKHPITPYLYFCMETRPKLRAAGIFPSGTLLGERWRSLSAEEKRRFKDMAEEDQKRYRMEMAAYIPPATIAAATAMGTGQLTTTSTRAKKDPTKPKHPITSYLYFCMETRRVLPTALGSFLGERWRALSASERRRYEDMAEADSRRYSREMAAYKAAQPTSESKAARSTVVQVENTATTVTPPPPATVASISRAPRSAAVDAAATTQPASVAVAPQPPAAATENELIFI